MSDDADKLKADIARTRANLAKKLEQAESQLREDFREAKDSVEEAVGTVRSVARVLNPKYQIRQRPLMCAGGSMLAGVLVTSWVRSSPRRAAAAMPRYHGPPPPPRPRGPSIVARVAAEYPEEVKALKSIAVQFVFGAIQSRMSKKEEPK